MFLMGIAGANNLSGDTLVSANSSWRYYEGRRPASLPDRAAWRLGKFNDIKWAAGSAPFFYGETVEGGTELGKMKNRYSSVFLRQTFDVQKAGQLSDLTLKVLVDDGFVAWINGVEVARHNVPTQDPTSTSVAGVDANEPHQFITFKLDAPSKLLVDGENTLAVLALNVSRGSDDFLFDASLDAAAAPPLLVTRVDPPGGFSLSELNEILVQFSQPVTGIDVADLQINAQPATAVTGSGAGPYAFKFAALPDGTAHVAWHPEHGITRADAPFLPLENTGWTYNVAGATAKPGRVVINEIMYHPVEEPQFDTDGYPVLDLAKDVHEYVELHNFSRQPQDLGGWSLSGGIQFAFPAGTTVEPGGFLLVARNPERLAAVREYALAKGSVLGPFEGGLSNSGDQVHLRDATGNRIDSVEYSDKFPWPIGADALGAGDRWTGIDPMRHQYRGISLERVNGGAPGDAPANWLASPLATGPSPARPNATVLLKPLPVVESLTTTGSVGGLIRATDEVRIRVKFSDGNIPSIVWLEYFIEDIDSTDEEKTQEKMKRNGEHFIVALPPHPDRTIVRYRILANRSNGVEVVSPRTHDPLHWYGYFVTPHYESSKPAYEMFISRESKKFLSRNIVANPVGGFTPKLGATPKGRWNETAPAVLVYEGVVRDIETRNQGSFWGRSGAIRSNKIRFPRYNQLNGQRALLMTSKDDKTMAGHFLFVEAGFPGPRTRWVDFWVNSRRSKRLEIEAHDQWLLERYRDERAALYPDLPREEPGRFFKSSGIGNDMGPYGSGGGYPLPPNDGWTSLQRYQWVFSLKNQKWRGHTELEELINSLAEARKDTATLQTYLREHWDVDRTLDSIALREWMLARDESNHNFFLWHRANGKWVYLPWDFDYHIVGEYLERSIFRGSNAFKSAFLQAFKSEYRERMFHLNNTLLQPANIRRMGLDAFVTYAELRQPHVNRMCLPLTLPAQPGALVPASGRSVLPPASLAVSAFKAGNETAAGHASTIWEIRSEQGRYSRPVFWRSSETSLTRLDIPFDRLQLGTTYYWRCTFVDADGKRSLPTPESSFRFGGPMVTTSLVQAPSALWKYCPTEHPGAGWQQLDFDDNAWPSGLSPLGADNLTPPVATVLPPKRTTYFLRTEFQFDGGTDGVELRIEHLVDDAALFYLNGQPVHSFNLKPSTGATPWKPIAWVTQASVHGPVLLPQNALRPGKNVLAVGVHQWRKRDTDLVFWASLSSSREQLPEGVVINEVMASNRGSVPNGTATPDWVELHNSTGQPVDLAGMSLVDGLNDGARFVFPNGTVIEANGWLVVWCDDDSKLPGLHTGFALGADGQTVSLLARTDQGEQILDTVTFGLQLPDQTIARDNESLGQWRLAKPTPGEANAPLELAPVSTLKINEWMPWPGSGADWFELYNPDDRPAPLAGLLLGDRSDAADAKPVAPLSFIAAHGFRKFLADQKTNRGNNHVHFKLSAGGETIGLFTPAGNTIDLIAFSEQAKGVSQGRYPDGVGPVTPFPGTATPGRPNTSLLDDGGSQLKIEASLSADGTIVLRFDSAPGKTYSLLRKETLGVGAWERIHNWEADPEPKSQTWAEPIPAGEQSRYYRLVTPRRP